MSVFSINFPELLYGMRHTVCRYDTVYSIPYYNFESPAKVGAVENFVANKGKVEKLDRDSTREIEIVESWNQEQQKF